MQAILSCESDSLSLSCGSLDLRRPLDTAPLLGFARRYILERASSDPGPLLKLGQDLRAWFDGGEDWLAQLRAAVTPPLELEIRGPRIPDAAPGPCFTRPGNCSPTSTASSPRTPPFATPPVRRLGPPGQSAAA